MLHFQDSEHVSMIRDTIERFVEKEMPRSLARQWDNDNYFPRDIHNKLVELGLMGLTVPEAYGGSGVDITATVMVIEHLCARSLAVGGGYIQSACYAGLNLGEVANEAQKKELLPKVIEDGLIFAYGISEPDVGADVSSVKTTARREGDYIVVNGNKRFCSGAAVADYIYTLVRSGPAEDRYKNLSLVLIPPNTQGVSLDLQGTLGLKGVGTYDVSFDEVRIPASQIIGGEEGWNNGWSKLVGPGLDIEKLEVAAMALGIATAAVNDAWAYSQERVQFGKPICKIQSIRHMLAEVKTKLEACRLMTYHAAGLIDQNKNASVETSMTKLFVCDTARDITIACQELMGAYGYVKDFDMERYVRDVLIMPIIGGSSAIQKNNIANRLNLPR
ncbi:acyl-CoA dehydrogenase family protein [Zhongshania borealis]|uniref:Acyl-CoA dehydrogenase family protein n=1 Tax=Zhongshania borealis TaxID=889488 RepID=A0ABP7X202_9GAMM